MLKSSGRKWSVHYLNQFFTGNVWIPYARSDLPQFQEIIGEMLSGNSGWRQTEKRVVIKDLPASRMFWHATGLSRGLSRAQPLHHDGHDAKDIFRQTEETFLKKSCTWGVGENMFQLKVGFRVEPAPR